MIDFFEIYEYHYKDKKSGLGMVIYARKDETAQKILNICNDTNGEDKWIPLKGRRFKKLIQTHRPPYELEQEQEMVALEHLERRKEYYAKKKGN